eukprot:6127196-Amphidinium_carterae.2
MRVVLSFVSRPRSVQQATEECITIIMRKSARRPVKSVSGRSCGNFQSFQSLDGARSLQLVSQMPSAHIQDVVLVTSDSGTGPNGDGHETVTTTWYAQSLSLGEYMGRATVNDLQDSIGTTLSAVAIKSAGVSLMKPD